MKYKFFVLLLPFLLSGVLFAEIKEDKLIDGAPTAGLSNPIRIVHPVENSRLPALASTYICGSVPAGGKLVINGVPVAVQTDGGFLTMVPLVPGKFVIHAELTYGDATYHLERTLYVAEPEKVVADDPLTIGDVTPRQDQALLPGDEVSVCCKGNSGVKAYFTVQGVRRKFPMRESGTATGIYHGVYRIGNRDRIRHSYIKVTLTDSHNRKKTALSQGTVSLFPNQLPVMVETTGTETVLRTGTALTVEDKAGYLMFPPAGTWLQVTGKFGDEYRVRLSPTQTVWVSVNQVKPLAEGTSRSHVPVGNIGMNADSNGVRIKIPLERRIPFSVNSDVDGNYVDLSLFGCFSNTDSIANASAGIVKQLRWFQDDEDTYRLRVYIKQDGWWGYDVRYEGNVLILELRTPPPMQSGHSSLEGLTIAVDPGHGAGGGAIGVTGYAEGDANLAMAFILKEKLVAKGAKVIMTRSDGTDVALAERPRIAWGNRADLLISLHNNSMAYGGNPLQRHGFGVYYYTPVSLGLAREIHTAYLEKFTANPDFCLPDDGLYYSNLALTRTPQMPSVLIESAYMINPQEEAYLKTDSFRYACAEAIALGMERYARRMRAAINPPM